MRAISLKKNTVGHNSSFMATRYLRVEVNLRRPRSLAARQTDRQMDTERVEVQFANLLMYLGALMPLGGVCRRDKGWTLPHSERFLRLKRASN